MGFLLTKKGWLRRIVKDWRNRGHQKWPLLRFTRHPSKVRPIMNTPIPAERIASKIYLIRGKKVMLDRDLSELYCVPTKVLNQAVRRNLARFPEDFMFQLNKEEFDNWRSQFVTSNSRGLETRYAPFAFTEQGVAMLSSVLKSEQAVLVNIQIIRTFTHLREMIAENVQLRLKLEEMELRYDEGFRIVFDELRKLSDGGISLEEQIGFKTDV